MSQWRRVGPSHYQGGGYDLKRVGPPGDPRQWRLEGHGGTSYHRGINGARREAKRHGVTESSRRNRRENPGTGIVLAIGGGIALLGVAAYFFFKPQVAATTTASSAPTPNDPIVYTDPVTGKAWTLSQACQASRQLTAIGHPTEAAWWANICRTHGGSV